MHGRDNKKDGRDVMIRVKRLILAALLAFGCVLMSSCDYLPGRDKAMDGIELDGFYSMQFEYTPATTRHKVDEVTKITYTEFGYTSTDRTVAIDLFNKGMHTRPSPSPMMDDMGPDYKMSGSEVRKVRCILERHGVLDWELVNGIPFSEADPEQRKTYRVGWVLFLQYSDNTVDRFVSYGDVYPDTYEAFIEELLGFANARRDVSWLLKQ
jgi:hypothetical protein